MTGYPWRVVHLDLGVEVPALNAPEDARGLYVVFWSQDIPLGHIRIPARQLPLPATAVAHIAARTIARAVGNHLFEHGFNADIPGVPLNAETDPPPLLEALLSLSRPLDALQRRQDAPETPSTEELSVTVAVCTRERPEPLRRCLQSLRKLRPAPAEILVVDNAPTTDSSRQVVEEFPEVRYVLEPRIGLDAARNAALREARGMIIAFADDDVVVRPNWIRALRRGFDDPKVLAVTGLVLPAELETESQVLFEEFWSFNRGYRARVYGEEFMRHTCRRGAPVAEIGAGANMAFRREVRDCVGYFDERLDAGAAGCSGDSEYWYRILAAGFRCRYEPTAVVHHYHRRELEGFKRQIYYYMRGHTAALLVQYERHRHAGNLRRLTCSLPRDYWRRTLMAMRGHIDSNRITLGQEMLGCLSGVKYYFLNRQSMGKP